MIKHINKVFAWKKRSINQIARLEMFEERTPAEEVSLSCIIEHLLDELDYEFNANGIHVKKQKDYSCNVVVDVELLVSVLRAVMENFQIYADNGKTLEVLIEDCDENVRLRFRCLG